MAITAGWHLLGWLQGDSEVKEGEYLPKDGLTDEQVHTAIEEVIALNMQGKKGQAEDLLRMLMDQDGIKEKVARVQKKRVASSGGQQCHGKTNGCS